MSNLRKVALLIETSAEHGRGILRGVARYQREHGPWSIYFQSDNLNRALLHLANWRGDGILARIDSRKMAEAVKNTRLPAIDLRGSLPDLGLPFVGMNPLAVARLVAEHLLDRGFRNFGYCGTAYRSHPARTARRTHFEELIRGNGHSYGKFQLRSGPSRVTGWEREQDRLAGWLAELPKPVGLMGANDECGRRVLDACQRANLLVPDEVAVVSVDNDEHLCSLSNPPLSSVDTNAERVGYEAAGLLERMMQGHEPPREPVQVEPLAIAVRQSSDVLAIDDADTAAAVRFIREHAGEGLRVDQVVRHVNLSRSTLEHRFKKLLGRTPKAEIMRVQINLAKQLLATSDLTLATIAEKSGFRSVTYFAEIMRKRLGTTPGNYRKLFKMPGADRS